MLSGVFSLTGCSRWILTGLFVSRTTQDTTINICDYFYGTITLYGLSFQTVLILLASNIVVLQPQNCRNNFGLGYSAFARRYLRNHYCFLFLRLLRCFSSPGLLLLLGDMSSTCRVAPFGYLRIIRYVPLPVTFRSLSRPSSPLRA